MELFQWSRSIEVMGKIEVNPNRGEEEMDIGAMI
jgi:hypothetical protein